MEHMALNIKKVKVRVRVPNIAREEYKLIVVDISVSMRNMAVRKTRI
jgi:hypothetical protein